MLSFDVKSNRSGKWETTARAIASEAAKNCDTIDEFLNYYNSVIKDRKRDSVGHIADSYKVERLIDDRSKVALYHHAANKRLIAIISMP